MRTLFMWAGVCLAVATSHVPVRSAGAQESLRTSSDAAMARAKLDEAMQARDESAQAAARGDFESARASADRSRALITEARSRKLPARTRPSSVPFQGPLDSRIRRGANGPAADPAARTCIPGSGLGGAGGAGAIYWRSPAGPRIDASRFGATTSESMCSAREEKARYPIAILANNHPVLVFMPPVERE